MADITSSSIDIAHVHSNVFPGIAREAIAVNEIVYWEDAPNRTGVEYWCNLATHANILNTRQLGIAVSAATGANQSLGFYPLGASELQFEPDPFTLGELYCLSATAGKIAPYSDLVSTDAVIPIGHLMNIPVPDDPSRYLNASSRGFNKGFVRRRPVPPVGPGQLSTISRFVVQTLGARNDKPEQPWWPKIPVKA